MTEYLHGSHSIFIHHFHIVWVTKYRKNILVGDIALKLREIIRDICNSESVTIMKGSISKDHVHLFLSLMPKHCMSKLVQRLKGTSSHKLMMTFPSLNKEYWGRHMWARGYFSCTSGNITDEMIANYISNQSNDVDEDFKID
jgi:putative transposase